MAGLDFELRLAGEYYFTPGTVSLDLRRTEGENSERFEAYSLKRLPTLVKLANI